MRTTAVVILASALGCISPLPAQEPTPVQPAAYKVDFNIKDATDPAAKGGRKFSMLVDANRSASFRLGDRVPVSTGSSQYTYLDTGVNIEARLHEMNNGRVAMESSLDISAVVDHNKSGMVSGPNPTVAQIRISVSTVLTLSKTTQVASVDDPVSQHKFDVDATVTKMN